MFIGGLFRNSESRRKKGTKTAQKQNGVRLRTVYCAACPESGSRGGRGGAQGGRHLPPDTPDGAEMQLELTVPLVMVISFTAEWRRDLRVVEKVASVIHPQMN